MKWIKKDQCFKKSVNKRENISRKCFLRMKDRNSNHNRKEKEIDLKMSELKRSTQGCLRSKNKIE